MIGNGSRPWALLALLLTSCGADGGTGSVQIFVEAEASIRDGLAPGGGPEDVADGWSVTYRRFLVSIGNVRARRSDSGAELADDSLHVLDLLRAPAGGYLLERFDDVEATRWDRFGFELPNAGPGHVALAPTSDADAREMIDGGFSVLVAGALERPDGQSCAPTDPTNCVAAPRIEFEWGLPAGTSFDDCATEGGAPGFAVPTGGTAQVKPTIHGDHWFFSSVTSGAEIVVRYAQYVADCDLDRNGKTTLDELRATKAADVFPSSRYQLSGALGGGILSAYDYVLDQARTLGDYQGDGECPTRSILP